MAQYDVGLDMDIIEFALADLQVAFMNIESHWSALKGKFLVGAFIRNLEYGEANK